MSLFVIMLLVVGSLSAQMQRASLDLGFDRPTKQTIVDLGPSPYYTPNQHVRKKLTCYYYPAFTVKEYDEGQKGAELSILHSAHSACTRARGNDENGLAGTEWKVGYFLGAISTYAIIDAPDGVDGGLPFAVFDVKTGRKVIEDTSRLAQSQPTIHTKDTFRISREGDQTLRLTYLRVVHPECDLNSDAANCWEKARTMFGITQIDIPACTGYQQVREKLDSVIAYPVSVVLADSPEIKAAAAPVVCWPIE